jgi:hypothetical protein
MPPRSLQSLLSANVWGQKKSYAYDGCRHLLPAVFHHARCHCNAVEMPCGPSVLSCQSRFSWTEMNTHLGRPIGNLTECLIPRHRHSNKWANHVLCPHPRSCVGTFVDRTERVGLKPPTEADIKLNMSSQHRGSGVGSSYFRDTLSLDRISFDASITTSGVKRLSVPTWSFTPSLSKRPCAHGQLGLICIAFSHQPMNSLSECLQQEGAHQMWAETGHE